MEKDKNIKTVVAPALVVVETDKPKVDEPEPTVLDTQKIKKLILEAAHLVTAEENAKVKTKVNNAPKSPPYLLVILLMVLFGLLAVVVVLTLRQDLDFIIVSGGVFLLVTGVINTIFQIMKSNQSLEAQREANITQQLILQETHEANVKAELALKATKETHGLVNSQWDEFKKEEKEKKDAEIAAYDRGRSDAEARADKKG